MLYTSYLANINTIPAEVEKLFVVRIPPKGFDFKKNSSLIHAPELSPSKPLLMKYKYDDDWNSYAIRFKREMRSREDMKNALKDLDNKLREGEDVCLVCFEKEYHYCHRYLIAQWAIEKGHKWEEV